MMQVPEGKMSAGMTAVGSTSRWIAAARALESEGATPLFRDPYARQLAGAEGFAILEEMRRATGPTAAGQGPDLYLSLRTKFLDDNLLNVVRERGLSQVVLLAAGMDTRAFRLAWPDGVRLFELDRDDVFDWKESVLAQVNATPACDRRVIRADLAGDWVPRLLEQGFDPHTPSAFLAEGLLMYLEPAAVDRVLGAISALTADGSWLGLDAVNTEMLTSAYTSAYMKRLADFGAPWLSALPNPEIRFATHGWDAAIVMPGDPNASYGRWTFPTLPRSVPGIPRTFFLVASKSRSAARHLPIPVSSSSAEHYRWGNGCDGWHLVRQEGVSVIEEQMPPGTAEERHRHARARQFFYVLNGTLEIEMEGTTHTLSAGSGLEIPPGAAHTAMNRSQTAVRFLLVSQPPAHGDREPA